MNDWAQWSMRSLDTPIAFVLKTCLWFDVHIIYPLTATSTQGFSHLATITRQAPMRPVGNINPAHAFGTPASLCLCREHGAFVILCRPCTTNLVLITDCSSSASSCIIAPNLSLLSHSPLYSLVGPSQSSGNGHHVNYHQLHSHHNPRHLPR